MRADKEFLHDLGAQERPLLSRADYVRNLIADKKAQMARKKKGGG